jgi:uncharacterized protein DUF4038/collagenase-like protein with putative collagen-binding domain
MSRHSVTAKDWHVVRRFVMGVVVVGVAFLGIRLISATDAVTLTKPLNRVLEFGWRRPDGLAAPQSVTSHISLRLKARFPLTLSADGRYLKDQSDNPFFLVGDSPWYLNVILTGSEIETYLDDRAARGFNAILLEVISRNYQPNGTNNANNSRPFMTADDFTTPGARYWQFVDSVLTEANERGIAVMFFPMYLGFSCTNTDGGWCPQVQAQTTTQLQSYGAFLGQRYKNQLNIIWVLGGDATGSSYAGIAAREDAFVKGLQSKGDTHPITYHARRTGSARALRAAPWMTINTQYSDWARSSSDAVSAYGETPYMPSFLIEAYYENEQSMTNLQLRNQYYWSVLGGSHLGFFFGSCNLFQFNRPGGTCSPNTPWRDVLNQTPSKDAALVGRLFRSRRHWLLAPNASIITSGASGGASLAVAARASDGSSVIAYIPTGNAVTIDMTKVGGGTARAHWYNPRTGDATLINDYSTSGTRTFSPPDANDWVLVLDNASAAFAAPGAFLLA